MLKILKEDKKPIILVVTPLFSGHSIYTETKVSIKRNEIPYTWISYTSNNKHAKNCQLGIDTFKEKFGYLPEYIFILDRDIIAGRYMLDKFHNLLSKTPINTAYTYCGFAYTGYTKLKIPALPWDLKRLRYKNFISSNSLYKTKALLDVGGLVTDEDTHRLSDWAWFLKAANKGYEGILCQNTSFIAISTPNDISAKQGDEEFHRAKKLVIERYINGR